MIEMAYKGNVVGKEAVVVVSGTMKMGSEGDGRGDYVRLWESESEGVNGIATEGKSSGFWCSNCRGMNVGVLFVFCVLLSVGVAAFVVWGFPLFLNKLVLPILDWERRSFSKPTIGLLVFASLAIFPTLLIPSSPSMWVAGITFGYGHGFLLIMAGASLGMSLPFFIGYLFHHRINLWLEKWPKQTAIVRVASEGDWFHQFRAVTLLRISPFPYTVFNYAIVATSVKYSPYIFGSLVGVIPDVFIAIYSGFVLCNLADATDGRGVLSMQQIICNLIGFCVASASTICITMYAKRTLQIIQAEADELV